MPAFLQHDQPRVGDVGRHLLGARQRRHLVLAADIGNSRLVVLEECGHMSPLEKPAEVTAALRRWLTQ